jgi:hypothetical protein
MKKQLILLFFVITLIGIVSAQSITLPDIQLNQNQRQYVEVRFNAPTGLTGYDITATIQNSSVGRVLSASIPSWGVIQSISSTPSSSVTLIAVDLHDQIKPGATNVLLFTLEVEGLQSGSTSLALTLNQMDDNNGLDITGSTSITGGAFLIGEGYSIRPKTAVTAAVPPTHHYQTVIDAFGADVPQTSTPPEIEWMDIAGAIEGWYVDGMDAFFYVFVFSIPFVIQYLRQGTMIIPSVLGIITAGFLLMYVPAEYELVAVTFIALGVLGVIWGVVKERM